ncbi:MAG: metal-dependent phosphohydrolase [Proteobacteria bacterium]|nr:metal-dependent phosphohydrolase [Pseudomonadota bacterium]
MIGEGVVKETLPTSELCVGMYVSDLDRPWLGTPFLLQGFLIEDTEQITQLQQCCKTVEIDRSRSIGDQAKSRSANFQFKPSEPAPRTATVEEYVQVDEAKPEDFPAICRLLRNKRSSRRFAKQPAINPVDGQSRLEPEMLYSAPIIDDIKQTLEAIRNSFDLESGEKIRQISALVGELAGSVSRNPDAMLWLTRLKSTDRYSYDHAVDVSIHLMIFGRFLNLAAEMVEKLGLVGMMQDIGKVDIPQDVLNKPDRLTDEEYALIQSHVASSLEMLANQANFDAEMLEIVAGHHERHDGSGYPSRLQGEKISLNAELAGMIDAYCAMTRNRSYNPAVSHQRALEYLIGSRGSKFREALVDQFIQCMGLYPVGTLVELNSSEVAVVIQQNRVRRLQPRVLIVLAADKSIERYPRTLDLMMNPATALGETYRILRSLPPDAYGINPSELYLA